MKKNSAQKICTICFIVALALTLILWCVTTYEFIQASSAKDDPLGYSLGLAWLPITLAVALVQEIIFYITLRYFLADREYKTRRKNLLYGAVFLVNLFVVVKEIVYFL